MDESLMESQMDLELSHRIDLKALLNTEQKGRKGTHRQEGSSALVDEMRAHEGIDDKDDFF
jgi:hypothetical protein